MRCESPSTFLGTCLSHHSFIIFLVTNTNTLLSGLYLISTILRFLSMTIPQKSVNALSGLYLISTTKLRQCGDEIDIMCQCPLGLIPHFYPVCPVVRTYSSSVNALSGLYLISTVPFKNLGFMRFPEPVFAGIYQNILTTAVFRAC